MVGKRRGNLTHRNSRRVLREVASRDGESRHVYALKGGDAARAADCARSGELHAAFGATRVGPLLDRLRLHLRTDRFLAERRRDAIWEASCDYASLTLARIAAEMSVEKLAERVIAGAAAGGR